MISLKETLFVIHVFPLLFGRNLVMTCPTECSCFGSTDYWIADCARKNLTKIPEGFSVETTEIYLQHNDIREIEEKSFFELSKLKYLFLHNNNISSIVQSAFASAATSLLYLTLNHNRISHLEPNTFSSMRSLKVLNLNGNLITKIDSQLFEDLQNVTQLSTSNNQIDTIDNKLLDNARSLTYSSFSNNHLTFVPDSLGGAARELYVIDFGENHLKEVPCLPSTLRQVYLTKNEITAVSSRSLSNASSLYELFLHDNRIASVDRDAFEHTPGLGWLDLSLNNLSETNSFMFEHLSALKGLNLTGNKALKSIQQSALVPLNSSLIRFSFDKCNFSNIDPDVINVLRNNELYIWAGSNPWNCDCEIQPFVELIRNDTNMFYDVNTMLCTSPIDLNGRRIDHITPYEFATLCKPQNTSPDYTALIVSMSILGSAIVVSFVAIFVVKFKQKSKVLSVKLNSESGTESPQQ